MGDRDVLLIPGCVGAIKELVHSQRILRAVRSNTDPRRPGGGWERGVDANPHPDDRTLPLKAERFDRSFGGVIVSRHNELQRLVATLGSPHTCSLKQQGARRGVARSQGQRACGAERRIPAQRTAVRCCPAVAGHVEGWKIPRDANDSRVDLCNAVHATRVVDEERRNGLEIVWM